MFSQKRTLGLHFRDDGLFLAEVSVHKGGIQLNTLSSVNLKPGVIKAGVVKNMDALVLALKELKEQAEPQALSEKVVQIAIPDFATYFHVFSFSGKLKDQEIENALSFEVEEVVPFDIDEITGDYALASRNKNETSVLFAAVPNDILLSYQVAVKHAGLIPGSFVLEAQAMERLLALSEQKEGTQLIADISEHAASLFVVGNEGLRATFSQAIGMTPGPIPPDSTRSSERIPAKSSKAPAEQVLTPSQLKAISKRIQDIISWYEGLTENDTINDILLVGTTASVAALRKTVSELLVKDHPQLNVGITNPFEHLLETVAFGALRKKRQKHLFAPAIGAAIIGANPEPGELLLKTGNRKLSKSSAAEEFESTSSSFRTVIKSGSLLESSGFTTITRHTKMLVASGFFLLAIVSLVGALSFRAERNAEVRASMNAVEEQKPRRLGAFDHVFRVSTEPEQGELPAALLESEPFEIAVPVTEEDLALIASEEEGEVEYELTDEARLRLEKELAEIIEADPDSYLGDQLTENLRLFPQWTEVEFTSGELGTEEEAVFTAILKGLAFDQTYLREEIRNIIARKLSVQPEHIDPDRIAFSKLQSNGMASDMTSGELRLTISAYPQAEHSEK